MIDVQSGIWYFYHYDALGSVVALSNTSGTIVERYRYDAFGITTVCDGNGTPLTENDSAYGNPYTFTGRRLDVFDSGDYEKYHYRHRDMDSYMGRFYQQDPLGYVDGMNLYEYVISNPVCYIDTFGLHFFIPGNFKWWPPNGYIPDILEGRRIYDTIDPPLPIYDPYRGYIDPVGEIMARARVTAGIGGITSPDAKRLLLHFLSNTVGTLDSDYPRMIAEDPGARAAYESVRNAAVHFVRMIPAVRYTGIMSMTDQPPSSALKTKNWIRAIHGYLIAAWGTNIKCRSMDLKLELRDYYDWDKDDDDKVGLVSPAELYKLHVWGKSQFYEVYGHYKVHLEWDDKGNIKEN